MVKERLPLLSKEEVIIISHDGEKTTKFSNFLKK
jgi:hypothetical protein